MNGSDSSPTATGVLSPPSCRFATLTHGLAAASDAGMGATVLATGFAMQPVVFSAEAFPLVVPPSVTLSTTAPLNAADYVVAFSGAADAGVIVGAGATFSGFSLLAGSGASVTGVDVEGTGASLAHLLVSDFDFNGVRIEAAASATAQTLVATRNQVDIEVAGALLKGSNNVVTNDAGSIGLLVDDAGSVNLDTLTAEGNGLAAIVSDGGFPGVVLLGGTNVFTNSTFQGNGGAGLRHKGGVVYLTSDTFTQNCATNTFAAGLQIENGAVDGGAVTTTANTCNGVAVVSGTVYVAGLVSTGNASDGVRTTTDGAVVTLVNPSLDQNALRGLYVQAGTVDVSGIGSISQNGSAALGSGIRADLGSLTVTGSVDAGLTVSGNAGVGVYLVGASSTFNNTAVTSNGLSGFDVFSPAGNAADVTTTISSCLIQSNGGDGINVHASPTLTSADTFTATGNTIVSNTRTGIALVGDAGSVTANISTNTLAHNVESGLVIAQPAPATTIAETVQGNSIFRNGVAGVAGTPSPGVNIAGGTTLNAFTSNAVAGNGAAQVLVSGGATFLGGYNLSGAVGCATANLFYCYSPGYVGLQNTAAFPSVPANYDTWANTPPTSGVDYSPGVSITGNHTCAASGVLACPP